ncbi:protein-L-isoaspartate O-methyltransferase [Candidatus Falkowbacteria bacterium CG_4_9_14_3_um_filter_38_19]|uniref:Protein-L-isoaspartate O-methyltransferase n=1 Tax=Candidatus Falkowbacteria bacterium CG_4_9_14_3_um_filter_38_19 TaxID=1974559 RepID=A0A2M8AEM8_9BACT|nr:MAG: protein-L-isoaspartate O-methyltransferase [Candidatus Falkowbacteria bacterium CG_4_9_14_3_um_filter_38_19]
MALIDNLIKEGYLKTPKIIEAFKKVKRQDFVRSEDKELAELNEPLPIGYGQTISQPLTVAFMLELLTPQDRETILDVGSGSGWTVALLASIVGNQGKVYGLEKIKALADFAASNVGKYNFLRKGIVQIFCTDGYLGLPQAAPFDKIIVAAAAEEIPNKLLEQLKIGGKLVIPVGNPYESQTIEMIAKIGPNKYNKKSYPGFIFVPLVKE